MRWPPIYAQCLQPLELSCYFAILSTRHGLPPSCDGLHLVATTSDLVACLLAKSDGLQPTICPPGFLRFFTQAGVWRIHIRAQFNKRVSPSESPCGPVERALVEGIPCPDTKLLAASVGGLGREYSEFCPMY